MKKIVSLFLCFLMLLSLIPLASAASAAPSGVAEEVALMTFDGKAWDPSTFMEGKDKNGIYVISVDEVGFNYDGGKKESLDLYFYLYNPSGKDVDVKSDKNRVQMAVKWNDDGSASAYDKFNLEFIDASKNDIYLKFKLVDKFSTADPIQMWQRVQLMQLRQSKRLYEISGVELLTVGDVNATEYAYGAKVTVTGFEAGCGKGGNNVDSKQVIYNSFVVLEQKVHQSYWRTTGSYLGANHKNQINQCYFSIPREIWEEYEALYSIKCEWEEYRSTPMIVTDDEALYQDLNLVLGKKIMSDVVGPGVISSYSLGTGYRDLSYGVYYWYFDWSYNLGKGWDLTGDIRDRGEICDRLSWLFKSKEEISLNDTCVSVEEILKYLKDNQYLMQSGYLFDTDVGNFRKAGYQIQTITFDDTFRLLNYNDGDHSWLEKLADYNIFNGGWVPFGGYTVKFDETYPDLEPIEVFGSTDKFGAKQNGVAVVNYTPEVLKDRFYFRDVDEASKFQEFCQEEMNAGNIVILLRYAETDYYSEVLHVSPEIDGHAIVSEQNIFLNFDVIELQFKGEDQIIRSLPMVSSPTTGVGGIDAPSTDNTGSGLVGEEIRDQLAEKWQELVNSIKPQKEDKTGIDWSKILTYAMFALLAIIVLIVVFSLLRRNGYRSYRRNSNYSSGRQKYSSGGKSRRWRY